MAAAVTEKLVAHIEAFLNGEVHHKKEELDSKRTWTAIPSAPMSTDSLRLMQSRPAWHTMPIEELHTNFDDLMFDGGIDLGPWEVTLSHPNQYPACKRPLPLLRPQ